MLQGKVAIVTGAAGGRGGNIGPGVVQTLARKGAAVVVADLNGDGAEAVAKDVRDSGGAAAAVQVDVSDEAAVRHMVEFTIETYGRVDLLHNNAAAIDLTLSGRDDDVLTMDLADWNRLMAVNLNGVFLGCKYVLPHMVRQQSGSIVNTSSAVSLLAESTHPGYCTSKAAVNGLTRSVACRHGRNNVRCNAILPGMILSENAEVGTEDFVQEYLRHNLIPTLGRPDDIGEMVAFLGSDASRYITGQLISVDGGLTVHQPTYAAEVLAREQAAQGV